MTKTSGIVLPKQRLINDAEASLNTTISSIELEQRLSNIIIHSPNILHNWDFTRPVNQRAITGTFTAANQYFIDRWVLLGGSVTLTPNGLTLDGTIQQRLEHRVGMVTTTSVQMYSGEAEIVFDDTATPWSVVNITSSGGTISRTKLEAGRVSTIDYDPPMDFGRELATCQRYFRRIFTAAADSRWGATSVGSPANVSVQIHYPEMRAVPVLVHNIPNNIYPGRVMATAGNTSVFDSTGATFSFAGATRTAGLFSVGRATPPLVPAAHFNSRIAIDQISLGNGLIALSAEL